MRVNYDFNKDYFAVLGVHYGACADTVKLAYRKMARRYHPDVSKIHNAQMLFQEVALAYEILSKYRDDYCHEYNLFLLRNHAKVKSEPSKQSQSSASSFAENQNPDANQAFKAGFNHQQTQNSQQSTSNANHSEDQSTPNYRHHKPINGKDRVIVYPLTLRYAIRLLHLGSFYIPALKRKIKFTRKAFENKTFKIEGKGYAGLFGGKPGDFLVKFDIKIDTSRYQLKGADIYSTVMLSRSLFVPGDSIRLDVVSGKVEFLLPENYTSENHIKIPGMGLPADKERKAGDLFIRVVAS